MKRRRKSMTVEVIEKRRVFFRVGMVVLDRSTNHFSVGTIVAIKPAGPVLKRRRFFEACNKYRSEHWQAQWENVRPANDGRRYA